MVEGKSAQQRGTEKAPENGKESLHSAHVNEWMNECIWWMQNVWSVADLLHWNSHWWSPVTISVYGVNLDKGCALSFTAKSFSVLLTTVSVTSVY